MTTGRFDVAVVGAGPVGCVLAVLLAQKGRRVIVLERWPERYGRPRAVHFDDEVGRILQACGLGDGLGAISEPGDVYEWRNGQGTTLLRFGRSGNGDSGWPQSSMFNQPALEALLDRRIADLDDIVMCPGSAVSGLEVGNDSVTLTYDTSSASGQTVCADFVVGCDGANSTVRDLISAPVVDLGFFYDWLIVDLVLHKPRRFDPINVQICDPARPTTVVSGGPGRRRWEFMRLPGEAVDQLDEVERAWELLQPWNIGPDDAALERHAVYTFQARWVEQWRSGRVLLAGDAAHQMPPFAGQGMCSGLRDAINLAWKIDLVMAGMASCDLLESYGTERMEHVRTVIEFSMELGKVICVPDVDEAGERDRAMASVVRDGVISDVPPLPGITAGVISSWSPCAGNVFIQGTVESAGGVRRLDDVVGVGWRIITMPDVDPALPADLDAWFRAIGGVSVAVGTGSRNGDPSGVYDAWFADHGASAVLQRPDFVIFGQASDQPGLVELVTELRTRLS